MASVGVEMVGDVAVVTVANPPANLFDGAVATGLLAAVQSAESASRRSDIPRVD